MLIDFFELSFQFALKSAVFELEICSLHQNGIEFSQKTNKVCFRMDMTTKLATGRQFLFTYLCPLAGPECSVGANKYGKISLKSSDIFNLGFQNKKIKFCLPN